MHKKHIQFNLEYQYQMFLQLVALSENEMHPQQKIQLRQSFMAACGQMMILMRDEVTKLPTTDAAEVMNDLMNQVGEYWESQTNQGQGRKFHRPGNLN